MPSGHVLHQLEGYLDRELDLAASLEVERHLEACPQCRAEFESLQGLHARVTSEGAYYRAPDTLRKRVRDAARAEAAAGGLARLDLRRWLTLAASFVLVAGLSSGATYLLSRDTGRSALEDQVVSSHVRSLLVENRLTDVSSSDEHTVKPWFNRRLDFAPPVDDWTAQGFPLVGGRLDYLSDRPVAALVYRHRQHFINLFVWPSAGARPSPVEVSSRQGYALVHWSDAAMTYWAVSDLNSVELAEFCEHLRHKTAHPS